MVQRLRRKEKDLSMNLIETQILSFSLYRPEQDPWELI